MEVMESWVVRRLAVSSSDWLDVWRGIGRVALLWFKIGWRRVNGPRCREIGIDDDLSSGTETVFARCSAMERASVWWKLVIASGRELDVDRLPDGSDTTVMLLLSDELALVVEPCDADENTLAQ